MKRAILLVAFLVGLTAPAMAVYENGNALYERCISPKDTPAYMYCLGYITGSFDQFKGSEEYKCVAQNKMVTQGQIKDVVIAYLRKKSESRHFTAESLVRNAVYYAFCE